MKKLSEFSAEKIDAGQMNLFVGGLASSDTSIMDITQTFEGDCGDTKKVWYNETGGVCCMEVTFKSSDCCPPV